jgi:hypothetical protein
LCGEQEEIASISPADNECATNGQRQETKQEKWLSSNASSRQAITGHGCKGHCELCDNNGSGS